MQEVLRTNETLVLPETLELQQARIGLALGGESVRLRNTLENARKAAVLDATPDKLQVYRGRWIAGYSSVSIGGSGGTLSTDATGSISGTRLGYDYREIYQVFDLSLAAPAAEWFRRYLQASNISALEELFRASRTTQLAYRLEYTLEPNNQGIPAVYIYYHIIRIALNGETKDYIVTNPASSGAVTPDGQQPYPGYHAVPADNPDSGPEPEPRPST